MTRFLSLIILILISTIVIISLSGISHDAMLILVSIAFTIMAIIPIMLMAICRPNQRIEIHNHESPPERWFSISKPKPQKRWRSVPRPKNQKLLPFPDGKKE